MDWISPCKGKRKHAVFNALQHNNWLVMFEVVIASQIRRVNYK